MTQSKYEDTDVKKSITKSVNELSQISYNIVYTVVIITSFASVLVFYIIARSYLYINNAQWLLPIFLSFSAIYVFLVFIFIMLFFNLPLLIGFFAASIFSRLKIKNDLRSWWDFVNFQEFENFRNTKIYKLLICLLFVLVLTAFYHYIVYGYQSHSFLKYCCYMILIIVFYTEIIIKFLQGSKKIFRKLFLVNFLMYDLSVIAYLEVVINSKFGNVSLSSWRGFFIGMFPFLFPLILNFFGSLIGSSFNSSSGEWESLKENLMSFLSFLGMPIIIVIWFWSFASFSDVTMSNLGIGAFYAKIEYISTIKAPIICKNGCWIVANIGQYIYLRKTNNHMEKIYQIPRKDILSIYEGVYHLYRASHPRSGG